MRLITIRTPEGGGRQVAELAFENGIKEVAISPTTVVSAGGHRAREVVEVETATPLAKRFIEELMRAPFYDPQTYAFAIRHPESLFATEAPQEEVQPIVRPTTDVYEELYQFTKVTWSLVGRVFLSAILLCYGMVAGSLLVMVAGLLFLPYHHQMLCVALGAVLKEGRFLRQGALALLTTTGLVFLTAIGVGLVMGGPVEYEIKGSLLAGGALAAVIGVAAGLGSIDDAGRRELIGLATTAHITVYPAWFGLHVVLGLADEPKAVEHLFAFLINITTLTLAAGITFGLAGMRGDGIRRFVRSKTGRSAA